LIKVYPARSSRKKQSAYVSARSDEFCLTSHWRADTLVIDEILK
jgi:hypothetical protein